MGRICIFMIGMNGTGHDKKRRWLLVTNVGIVDKGHGVKKCEDRRSSNRRRSYCVWTLQKLQVWKTACLRKHGGCGVNRDGAFAEYLSLPESNVVHLDSRISDDMAAIMDPFGNAGLIRLYPSCSGRRCTDNSAGPIGTMATGICRFAGARYIVVSDLSDYRLDITKRWEQP